MKNLAPNTSISKQKDAKKASGKTAIVRLDQVGESTENPFEGNANDIPIAQMSRNVEIDIREMLGETDLPPVVEVKNNIVM